MARYLILGAGRFGRLALERLGKISPRSEFVLVDQDPIKLDLPAVPGLRTVRGEAAAFLAAWLTEEPWPEWIIPALPRHVAFDWLWQIRPAGDSWRQIPVPLALGQDLPFAHQGPAGELYLSLSTAICPDDCPEPAQTCRLTGAPRAFTLYEYLENVALQGFTCLVVRSRQLAPGVGGYRPADLWRLRRHTLRLRGNLLICTACRCHGVVHGLENLGETEAVVGF